MFAIRTTEAEESGRVQRRIKGDGKGYNASGDEGAAKTVIKKSVRDKNCESGRGGRERKRAQQVERQRSGKTIAKGWRRAPNAAS